MNLFSRVKQFGIAALEAIRGNEALTKLVAANVLALVGLAALVLAAWLLHRSAGLAVVGSAALAASIGLLRTIHPQR